MEQKDRCKVVAGLSHKPETEVCMCAACNVNLFIDAAAFRCIQ